MGVGMPDELAEYVARGVDMMDCVLPFAQRAQRLPLHLRRPRDH
jgi:tRNA-guanine family transglycosylase